MPDDLFYTDAWFDHLLAHGFEQAPHRHHVLPLASSAAGEGNAAHLHLMQREPRAPLEALSNYYSCLFGPVGEAVNLGQAQWRVSIQALRALPGSAVLRLQPLDADSAWLSAFESGLRAAGFWTDRRFFFGNWYQPVPEGGFEPYWTARPSALRHSVERGRRRLDKAGGEWRIDIVTGAADEARLAQAIAAYEAVYAQSWKGAEPCPDFMPGLMHLAAREGWLRLGVLWLDGQPLAAQVWLVLAGKANIYKLAYVKGKEKLSVGSVLTAELMRHTMDVDQVREVDYLSGDDAYKADWMAHRRERIALLAFDQRRPRGWLAAANHWGRAAVRRFRAR